MKKVCAIFSLFLCLLISITCFSGCLFTEANIETKDSTINMAPRKITATAEAKMEEIVKEVTPAVVGISAVYSNMESVGSGVAIASGGYIVTNDHVVEGANKITVYFANKTSANAKLIWNDPAMDLAIIKVETNMPYLEVGDSSNLNAGADVIAIGTPLTLQFKHTTTKGIISALNRTIEVENSDGTVSYLQNLIQHDSSINPGNSGGPLINSNGQVIGINTLKVTDAEGLGFAIPIEIVVPVMNKILQNGTYETPYLGLFGFDASIAKFYNRTLSVNGVYVLNIDGAGPASSAGLREGDIITRVDNTEILTMLDLKTAVYNYNVGDTIKITFLRNGLEKFCSLTLNKR